MPDTLCSVQDVVLFYADGGPETADYTLDYLTDQVEAGTREFHEKGGVTHIVPRHPYDPRATDADVDAWLEGKSRGQATNCRAVPVPCDMLGIDPKEVASSHRLEVDGRPAVPGWVADVKADATFFDEIREGVRPNFSAGFRRADSTSAVKWGLNKPYCDHFAAFGQIGAHCPPLSAQRNRFDTHEDGAGASSLQWFSEELHTMTEEAKTIRTLCEGLKPAELRKQFKEALKLDIFQEEIAEATDADGGADEKALTVDQIMKAIQEMPAAQVAELSSKFAAFQNSLLGAGGETFSEKELAAMDTKTRRAVEASAQKQADDDKRITALEGDRRQRTGDEFAEATIAATPLVGVPCMQDAFKEVCKVAATASTRDVFSAKDDLLAKSLVALAESTPTFEGASVETRGSGGTRDTFDEAGEKAAYQKECKAHGQRPTDKGEEIFVRNRRAKAEQEAGN